MADFLDQMSALPARKGPLPRMTPANPQEQLEQFPPDWTLIEELARHGFAMAGVIEQPTRIAPPGSRAMTLAPELPANPRALLIGREYAHIHNPPIGSMHLTLPEPHRAAAIAKQWVLRHPFAVRGLGPEDAVFVFAPRDEDELGWAKLLLTIAHAHASRNLPSGGDELQV